MKDIPNVILIVMDTVRADHLSCYGYPRETTPNIDRIARSGVLYENAFSAAPWTPPSHASIFTGKYPSHHKTLGKEVKLDKGNVSLPQILSQRGYRTIGITCCKLLGLGSGFEKGFQEFFEPESPFLSRFKSSRRDFKLDRLHLKDYVRTLIYGPDRGTYQATDAIKRFLKRRHKIRKPFFMFINYFNCHTPYDPPRPFKKRFCNCSDQSRFYTKELLLNRVLGRTTEKISDHNLNVRKLRWVASGEGALFFVMKELSVSQEEWEVVKSWYDGEIAYLDHQIGNLLEFLRDEDMFDNTLLIITSDHGENFGDHGLAVHPLCVYDSLLHVPLIVSYPDLIPEGKRIANLVSTVDIFPTVMDVSNIKFENGLQGKSLYPFENRKIHDFICAEYGGLFMRGLGGWKGKRPSGFKNKLEVIDKGRKCIRTMNYKYTLTNGKEELYNVRDDPSELANIVTEYSKMAKSLRKQLEKTVDISYFGPAEFPQANEKDREMLKRLKALGYF